MTSAGIEHAAGQALAISIATPKLPPDGAERWISPIKDEARTGAPARQPEFNHRAGMSLQDKRQARWVASHHDQPRRRQSLARACLGSGSPGKGRQLPPFC